MLGRFALRVALFFLGLAARRVGDLLPDLGFAAGAAAPLALAANAARGLFIGKNVVYSIPAFPFLTTNLYLALCSRLLLELKGGRRGNPARFRKLV